MMMEEAWEELSRCAISHSHSPCLIYRVPAHFQWEALVRLIWGMESEITAMYADENLEAAEYTTTIMIQVIYQYLGFSKEEITKMIAKVKRLLNRYRIEVHPDLTISVEKQKFKNI